VFARSYAKTDIEKQLLCTWRAVCKLRDRYRRHGVRVSQGG
jgi:hypothetical protein